MEIVRKTLTHPTDEIERVLTEMKEHGGDFVALDHEDQPIVYAPTLEEVLSNLQEMGLALDDVVISRVPEYGVHYL